jgi:hypothetical protein
MAFDDRTEEKMKEVGYYYKLKKDLEHLVQKDKCCKGRRCVYFQDLFNSMRFW